MKYSLIKIAFYVFVFSFLGCRPSVSEKITFNSSAINVKDSLVKLNGLMEKLPAEKENDFFKNCFVDFDGNWIVCNQNLGDINKVNVNEKGIFNAFTTSEKQSFKNIMLFLIKNKIYGNYRAAGSCYLYSYDPKVTDDYHETKQLLLKDASCSYLFSTHEVIDSLGDILLIKAK